jgi:glycosyltransferase involved in cell wall biosynthesis
MVPATVQNAVDRHPCENAAVDICVCGTQVPFTSGGAELLVANLVEALREADHRVETVLLPTAWDRDRILDAATAWRMVPLDFELAITLNFPSYFARHPRKVAWLLHQHRAAYDALGQPWSDFGLDDVSLEMHRALVEWDTAALAEAERRYAFSGVVGDRLARFNGLEAASLLHPPPLAERLHEGPFGDEVVCVTRLEANKRPDLFVEAFAQVTGPVKGALLGKGSQLEPLRKIAAERAAEGRGKPVEVVGFVDDDALIERLANARAVVYPPFDEDYGYATLQAFLAGKPVITTPDSGAVLEWVEHEVTGLITDGTAAGMAEAIDRLADDADLAARLGAAGHARAAALSWQTVVSTLVGDS